VLRLFKDTIVALQALTEFANRARIREVTDLSVFIELGGSPDENIDPVIYSSNNVTHTEEIEVNFKKINVNGKLNLLNKHFNVFN